MAPFLKISVFCSLIVISYGLPMVPIRTIQSAKEMLDLALGVNDLIDMIVHGSSNDGQLDQAQLLSDLVAHIDAAKVEILTSIILRSKLNKIDDAVQAVQSSLMDLKILLEAKTGVGELINIFIDRYEEHDVIKEVRFLTTLLTYVTPGDSVDLITLVREGSRCGATAFNDFRNYFFDLIVDGALLDIAYLTLKTQNVNIQTSIDVWVETILEADEVFVDQIPICNERFPSDIQIDVQINDDHAVLETELEKRYPDRRFDVIFYSGIGTNQFHGFRYSDTNRTFFWDRDLDSRNKVLVVIDNNGKPSWNKASTKSKLETCAKDISVDAEDARAAENVVTTLSMCRGLMYPIGTVIVYFESDDFPTQSVTTHSDSPVVELSMEDVKLEYCFKSGVLCTFSKDESSGRFRIFVYPNFYDEVGEADYVIAGSRRLHSSLLYWTAFVLVVLFRNIC